MNTIILCFFSKPYLQNLNTGEVHNKKCPSLKFAEKKNFKKLTTKQKDEVIRANPENLCKRCKSV